MNYDNPVYTGHLPRMERAFRAGTGGTEKDRKLGEAMLDRLRAAHDGTRDGVVVDIPWAEWDGYCLVVNDRTGG